MSDLVRNHMVGFPTRRLIVWIFWEQIISGIVTGIEGGIDPLLLRPILVVSNIQAQVPM